MVNHIVNNLLVIAAYILLTRMPCCRNNRGCWNWGATERRYKTSDIPQHEIESIASCLLPAMRAFFGSEEGKREFEKWQAAKAEREGVKPKKKT